MPMSLRTVVAVALLVLASFLVVPLAAADALYHTERLPLAPVAGAPLRSGFVVNIHPNGPQVYARERYVLNGAAPNTTYQVQLQIYANPDCTTPLFTVVTAPELRTNGAGNGTAEVVFTPEQVALLRGQTVGAIWAVTRDEQVVYQTTCTSISLD